jgi:hypothetical protein
MIGNHVTSQNWENAKKTSWCVKHVGGKITLIKINMVSVCGDKQGQGRAKQGQGRTWRPG